MTKRLFTAVLALALILGNYGCSTTSDSPTFRGVPLLPETFGLVLLRSGNEPPELTPQARDEAMAAHFGFMRMSAERGELLVAGPFGEPKDTGDLRGLFLFDARTQAEAATLGQRDPTTEMGVFRQESMTLDTLNVVRQLPLMVSERRAQAPGNPQGQPDVASYTVLFAEQGPEALAVAGSSLFEGRVVLLGRLGPPREDGLFGIFNVKDPAEVRARLAAGGVDVERIELARWYSTPALKGLISPGAEPVEDDR